MGSFFLLLATFMSHYNTETKCQGCRSAYSLPPYVDKERWQQVKKIDGVGMVIDTGRLAELTDPVHLALVTIVLRTVFLAQLWIELAVR